MANIFEFKGFKPVIKPSSFVHPNASVIGNVIVGENVYIGPGAALRGDFGKIVIGDGCNVQENCTIHMFPGVTVTLGKNVHMGHGSIIHGATIEDNVLIGMNAVIMDDTLIGEGCIIGALCLVAGEMQIPNRKLVVGNPGKIIKDVSDEMLKWKTAGTELYKKLPEELHRTHKPCEPLIEAQADQEMESGNLQTWQATKRNLGLGK